jgi:hypothetical protein
MLFKGGSSAWCPHLRLKKKMFTYFFKTMFIILIHLLHERIRQLQWGTVGPPPGLCHGTTGGFKAALRRPAFSCAPFRKSWICHCDSPMYPYVRCLCSIPSETHHFVVVVEGGGCSTSFATFYLYTSSLSLYWILYIPGGLRSFLVIYITLNNFRNRG